MGEGAAESKGDRTYLAMFSLPVIVVVLVKRILQVRAMYIHPVRIFVQTAQPFAQQTFLPHPLRR